MVSIAAPFVHNITIIVYTGWWDVYSLTFVHNVNEVPSIWHLLFKTARDISNNTEVTGKITQYVSSPHDHSLHSYHGTLLTGRYVVLANGRKTERRRKFRLESHTSYPGNQFRIDPHDFYGIQSCSISSCCYAAVHPTYAGRS